MSFRTLFLHQSDMPALSEAIKQHSYTFDAFNYIEMIQETSLQHFHTHLAYTLQNKDFNLLVIALDNSDASINLLFLEQLRLQTDTQLIFIFNTSRDSLEYIDRYYAQIADLIVIEDFEMVADYYTSLEIPFYQLITDKKEFTIIQKSVFQSSLAHLSPQTIFANHTEHKELGLQIKEIFHMVRTVPSQQKTLLLDKKFIYAQTIYKLYWIAYETLQKGNTVSKLLNIQVVKHLPSFLKLYKELQKRQKRNEVQALEVINSALYKEYKL